MLRKSYLISYLSLLILLISYPSEISLFNYSVKWIRGLKLIDINNTYSIVSKYLKRKSVNEIQLTEFSVKI